MRVIRLASTGSTMLPKDTVVASLNLDMTRLGFFEVDDGYLICLEVVICNKLVELPGSIRILCTLKSSSPSVNTKTSLCGIMTQLGLIKGNVT